MAYSVSSCRSRCPLYTDHTLSRDIAQLHDKGLKTDYSTLTCTVEMKGIKNKNNKQKTEDFFFFTREC